MIQLNDFLREVGSIAYERPTYRIRGRGADGTCDCVGLIMGSMYRNGHAKYPLHSSNYFARYETEDLAKINSDTTLEPGMVVYKARADNGQLDERYRKGGAHHAGDPLDYYHVGVVTQSNPLEITECTEGGGVNGIDYDRSIRGWTHCGWVKGVTRSYEEGESDMATYKAWVYAPSGTTVNLRERPNSSGKLLDRVPIGTSVTVNESAQGWAQVTVNGKTGYMMAQYLQYDPESGPAEPEAEPKEDGYEAIMAKLNEIVEILREMLADGARKDNEIQYTDTE